MTKANATFKSATHLLSTFTACALGLLTLAGTALAANNLPQGSVSSPSAGMMRFPAISATQIAFSYANDIYLAPRTGGIAMPLSSPPGAETFARFSPDGQTLAFVGNYEGNRDLYTMPVGGGVPTRITFHPSSEALSDWTPDGKALLYMTNGFAGLSRQTQLFSINAAGGNAEKLPMPYAGYGSISRDSKWVAFTPHSTDTRTWNRYRGGMATDIWLMNLETKEARKITDWEGNDTIPMWGFGPAAGIIYYLSDAGPEHRMNVWSFDPTSNQRTQITSFSENDVRWPSIGPGPGDGNAEKGEIIFQLGAELRVLDLSTNQSREVKIAIPGDRAARNVKPRVIDAGETFQGITLSPSAKRVLIGARGDVFSAPAKEGIVRNLTQSDATFERDPAWSPDGRFIAYLSDQSGEYELWVRPGDVPAPEPKVAKEGEEKKSEESADAQSGPMTFLPSKLSNLGPGFRYSPNWSPDSKKLFFTDNAGRVFVASLTFDPTKPNEAPTADVKEIDRDPWERMGAVAWSHDSNWLAYVKSAEGDSNGQIVLYDLVENKAHTVTSGMFPVSDVAFDRKGDWLYFVQNNNFSPRYSDLDTTWVYINSSRLMGVPLRADVKHPFVTKTDEESIKVEKDAKKKPAPKPDDKKDEAKKDEAKRDGAKSDDAPKDEPKQDEAKKDEPKSDDVKKDEPKKDDAKKEEKKKLIIELDDFEARAVQLPAPAGRITNLQVLPDGKLIYVRVVDQPPSDDDEPRTPGTITLLDITADEPKEQTVIKANGFELSADGKKLLAGTQPGPRYQIVDPVAGGGKPQTVTTTGLRASINPRNEWRQIINDVYRLQRDLFYVQNMHGVDWPKMRDHYLNMVDDAANREDVAWIIAQFISELNIGHAYVTSPGDVEQGVRPVSVGMLGADFVIENNALKIARIHRGAPWDSDARGPLDVPAPANKRVNEGDYILAVNGLPLDLSKDPYANFVGMAGKATMLTVSTNPTLDDQARQVLVKPIASETELRYRAWIEANRQAVAKATNNTVGYIYVPNTGVDGQTDLYRQFVGQRDMKGLIIDERWNGGGQIPTRFIELLNRPVTNYWARRSGKDWTWPPDGTQARMVMLANGLAGSGGDMFPWLFKHNKLGPVIGTRTWGGLVGITGTPPLIDGGGVSVPSFGFYEKDGTWGVEGHGVDPDIEVIDDPSKMVPTTENWRGGDPQLQAAIEWLNKEIAQNPPAQPKRPADPDRKGMGLPPQDK